MVHRFVSDGDKVHTEGDLASPREKSVRPNYTNDISRDKLA